MSLKVAVFYFFLNLQPTVYFEVTRPSRSRQGHWCRQLYRQYVTKVPAVKKTNMEHDFLLVESEQSLRQPCSQNVPTKKFNAFTVAGVLIFWRHVPLRGRGRKRTQKAVDLLTYYISVCVTCPCAWPAAHVVSRREEKKKILLITRTVNCVLQHSGIHKRKYAPLFYVYSERRCACSSWNWLFFFH